MMPAGLRKAREEWGAGEQQVWPWKGSVPSDGPPRGPGPGGRHGRVAAPAPGDACSSEFQEALAVPAAPCPLASSRAPPGLGAGWLGPWPRSSFLFLTAQVAGNHLHNGFPPATQPVGKGGTFPAVHVGLWCQW